jgi:hypothetical protein
MARKYGVRFQADAREYSLWFTHSLLADGYKEIFPRVQSFLDVNLAPHIHPVPRSRRLIPHMSHGDNFTIIFCSLASLFSMTLEVFKDWNLKIDVFKNVTRFTLEGRYNSYTLKMEPVYFPRILL